MRLMMGGHKHSFLGERRGFPGSGVSPLYGL